MIELQYVKTCFYYQSSYIPRSSLFNILYMSLQLLTLRKCAFRILLQLDIFPVHLFSYLLQLFASNDKSLGRGATKCMALPVQYRHKWFSLAFLDCLVEQFNKTFLIMNFFCHEGAFIVQGWRGIEKFVESQSNDLIIW